MDSRLPEFLKNAAILFGLLLCAVAFGLVIGFARGGLRIFLGWLF
jgi:hypothetical protein